MPSRGRAAILTGLSTASPKPVTLKAMDRVFVLRFWREDDRGGEPTAWRAEVTVVKENRQADRRYLVDGLRRAFQIVEMLLEQSDVDGDGT